MKMDETINYYGGGLNMTAALVTAVVGLVKTMHSIGKSFGSSLTKYFGRC